MKILIVDDEPDMVSSLARILRAAGFDVDTAYDGDEAIEKNLSGEPDAVLMDVRMPKRNGVSACVEVLKARPGIRVILMTGFSDSLTETQTREIQEFGQRPLVELMAKPVDVGRVIELINTRSN